jgi:hypothetical protein
MTVSYSPGGRLPTHDAAPENLPRAEEYRNPPPREAKRLIALLEGDRYLLLTTVNHQTELWQFVAGPRDVGLVWGDPAPREAPLDEEQIADASRRAQTADTAYRAAQAFVPLARRLRATQSRHDAARLRAFNAASRARFGGGDEAV